MFSLGYLKIAFREWRYNHRAAKQRKKQGFANSDCWNLNYWLLSTFPKMVLKLRDTCHGAAEVEYKEIESMPMDWLLPEIERISVQREKNDVEDFDLYSIFDRWYLILTRIAYCLTQANDELTEIENEYEEEFNEQVWGKSDDTLNFSQWWNKHHVVEEYDSKGKPKLYRLVTNDPDPELKEKYFNREKEIAEYRESMKNEGMELVKKYLYYMWD